ncbi:MAG: fructose-bisphosphatase class II, partial [Rhodospirillales bacterium]|nr:fructose-bisphosphatase class II [Rhodospirillales bacterium]
VAIDGDVSGAIAASMPSSGIDIYMGSGGAREGILTAAALRCADGQMQARLLFRGDDDRALTRRMGITDWSRKYTLAEMVRGEVMFAVTGVTDGAILRGVRRIPGGAITHSLVMRSISGTIRYIEAHHNLVRKAELHSEKA